MMTRIICVGIALALLPGLACGSDMSISVDASKTVATISPLLFGTNLHANDESTPEVRAFVRDIGIGLLRWPDGTDEVDWKTGVWSRAGNPESLSKSPLATFEGAAAFARDVKADMVCVLNPRLPPEYAAEWLKRARAIGFPVKHWVLGNEPYFRDTPEYVTLDEYVDLARKFSQALKAVDPSIKFGVACGGPWVNEAAEPGRDEKLLRLTADCIDFIDYHWYAGRSNDGSADPLLIVSSSERVPQDVAYYRDMLRRVAPSRADQIGIAYLEWDIFANEPGRQSLANALFYADTLGRFVTSGVSLATCYNLQEKMFGLIPGWCNEAGWGGNPWNGVTIRPKAYAIKLWRRHMGEKLVACRVAGVPPTFEPPPNWHEHINYHGAPVSYLVAYAGRDAGGKRLSLMVINKHPERSLTTWVELAGFVPAAEADLYQINGPGYLSHNDGPSFQSAQPAPPTAVRLSQSRLAVAGPRFMHTFPAHSVTVMEFGAR